MGASHPRSLGGLPDDDRVYTVLAAAGSAGAEGNAPEGQPLHKLTPFERECLAPRFPLAAPPGGSPLLPLGLTTDPMTVTFGGRPPGTADSPTPTRNGLDRYDASLFVDPTLAGLGVDTILAAAWDLGHVRRPPRRIRGVHALATLDDVTLVCVPDAVHTGWDHMRIEAPLPLSAPQLEVDAVDDAGVHIAWSAVPTATGYQVESDLAEAFPDADRTEAQELTAVVAARSCCPAPQFFRVRAVRGGEEGPWSNVVVTLAPPTTFVQCAVPAPLSSVGGEAGPLLPDTVVWRARTAAEAAPWSTLRAIQSSVVRWCAARGDVVRRAGVPRQFTSEDAVRHVSILRGHLPTSRTTAGRPRARSSKGRSRAHPR